MKNRIIPTPRDCDGFSLSDNDGDDKGLVFEKQLAYVGDFYKSRDDLSFCISEHLIDHWVDIQASLIKEGVEIPLPREHSLNPDERRGSVIEFFKRSDSKDRVGLFSKIRFNDLECARKAIGSQTSIYAESDITTGNGTYYTWPITHVAITDYPVIPGMDKFTQIAASLYADAVFNPTLFKEEKDKDMSLSTLAQGLKIAFEEGESDDAIQQRITSAFTSLKKQVSEFKKAAKAGPQPVAAGMLSLGKKHRTLETVGLLKDGWITTAQKDAIEKAFHNDDALTLSLSRQDNGSDPYEEMIEILKLGVPNKMDAEETGHQNDLVLSLSGGEYKKEKHSLSANMAARSAK